MNRTILSEHLSRCRTELLKFRSILERLPNQDYMCLEDQIDCWIEPQGIQRLLEVAITRVSHNFRLEEPTIERARQELKQHETPSRTKKRRRIYSTKTTRKARKYPIFGSDTDLRGPYQNYSLEQKQKAVEQFRKGTPLSQISRQLGIPSKNIKRWNIYGVHRRRGAGRKRIDPEMQQKLFAWLRENYKDGEHIEQSIIRSMALKLTTCEEFKGSKGWLAKFSGRYGIRQLYTLI